MSAEKERSVLLVVAVPLGPLPTPKTGAGASRLQHVAMSSEDQVSPTTSHLVHTWTVHGLHRSMCGEKCTDLHKSRFMPFQAQQTTTLLPQHPPGAQTSLTSLTIEVILLKVKMDSDCKNFLFKLCVWLKEASVSFIV